MVKLHREKSYQFHVSDNNNNNNNKKHAHTHNQTFVTHVLKKMLDTMENIPDSCIIGNNNCSSQYESAQHFNNIQNICNKIGGPITCLFSVTGCGKGKVNHVGG